MAEKEQWSWRKFLLGIFDGRNYAKAITFMVCGAIVLTICFSVYSVIKARFAKPAPIPAQAIGTNQGTVTTNNSSETKKGWQLFGGLVQINN